MIEKKENSLKNEFESKRESENGWCKNIPERISSKYLSRGMANYQNLNMYIEGAAGTNNVMMWRRLHIFR